LVLEIWLLRFGSWFFSPVSCVLNPCILLLSIIIVNYNVRYFLEQCLCAVQNAVVGMEAEVIVVDNHSADGSVEYLGPLFPGVQFIANIENGGFAKANNQALARASGEYVLFLNPDTLVPENCFALCLEFMKTNPEAGALGVRMIDGRGRFLPESKRAFPSPMASFYKLMGLAALFPASGIFNKYALGNLDEHKNHEVDVLAGACMLVKKKILDALQGFDESYFMYGEDIDLSYRVQEAGYQNHYFAGTTIIHFKGESSRKSGFNYVKFFYSAMLVFVQKHYKTGPAKLFSYFIRVAITCRAMVTALGRVLKPVLFPVIDGAMVWLALKMVSLLWISQIRNGKGFGFPYLSYALPFFAAVFILAAAFIGLYERVYKTSKTLLSIAFAAISILAVYSLLPETLRFSRGVILWGGILGGVIIVLLRQLLSATKSGLFDYESGFAGRTVVVATEKEYAEIVKLLENVMLEQKLLGRISVDGSDNKALCSLQNLGALTKKLPVSEIIFCEGELSLTGIIKEVQQFTKWDIRILYHLSGTQSIIGSDRFAEESKIISPFIEYRIAQPYQKRMKRLVDIILSFLFLITAPVHLIFHKKGAGLLNNAVSVITGHKTWVGYASTSAMLPPVKKGVVTQTGTIPIFDGVILGKADKLYAKNYDWWQDAVIVFRNYSQLGSGNNEY